MPRVPPTRSHKRKDKDRSLALEEVARLHRQGYSQREIAKQIGVSQVQISKDLMAIKKQIMDQAGHDVKVIREREYAVLMDVRREAFEALERSKADKEGRSVETTTAPKVKVTGKDGKQKILGGGITRKVREMREGRLADTDCMNVIIETSKRIAALYGLDEAAKIEFKGTMAAVLVQWDKLYGPQNENDIKAVETDPVRLALEQAVRQAALEQTGKPPEELVIDSKSQLKEGEGEVT